MRGLLIWGRPLEIIRGKTKNRKVRPQRPVHIERTVDKHLVLRVDIMFVRGVAFSISDVVHHPQQQRLRDRDQERDFPYEHNIHPYHEVFVHGAFDVHWPLRADLSVLGLHANYFKRLAPDEESPH